VYYRPITELTVSGAFSPTKVVIVNYNKVSSEDYGLAIQE